MTFDQAAIFAVLGGTMGLFIWGRWRYDIVAVMALMATVYLGLVPAEWAFSGFAHPAVITVAAVLVIGKALQNSGVVDALVRFLAPTRKNIYAEIGAANSVVATLSAFMNNVGALALMLPVSVRNSQESGRPASQVLMPLSFASLLGGLVTLIGTPPNIVIAAYREQFTGQPFSMFDFTPVGGGVALAGILFVTFIGWRLIPGGRKGAGVREAKFRIEDYIAEARLKENSDLVGRPLRDLEALAWGNVAIAGLVRGKTRRLAPYRFETLLAGDILILEADPDSLNHLVDAADLELLGSGELTTESLRSDRVGLVEAVVSSGSPLEGRTPLGMHLHSRYGLNLLAVSRQGEPVHERLGHVRFQAGDVLLFQGDIDNLNDNIAALGCLPLAERGLPLGRRRKPFFTIAIFGVAITAAAFGLVAVPVAFVSAVGAMILLETISLRQAYDAIEWPVIVLLGALIPIGMAMQETGATTLIADSIISLAGEVPVWMILTLLLVTSMLLSDLIHNTPTAVLMAPLGASIANTLDLPIDAFLMAVAVGAASPYLTPIGHQSNTLVMGPGGYHFGDYWRMGLPLDILIVIVAIPLIVLVWLP
jgi:di/tricarboxylate transporter